MKKLFKAISILGLALAITGGAGVQASAHSLTNINTESTIRPLADIIDWRYKIEDGKMYKRLYNYTTQQWVGEWTLVS